MGETAKTTNSATPTEPTQQQSQLVPPSIAQVIGPNDSFTQVKSKWGIRSHSDLQQRCRELNASSYLIEGLIPARTVSIAVGDSGLGKSALLYQMGICVAAGVPFLGCKVQQGRVLYLDFENGLGDSQELAARLARFLGLSRVPNDFLVWNLNDCPSRFGQKGWTELDMIREWASLPGLDHKLVFLDPLGAFRPEAEEQNSVATSVCQELRKLNRECGTTTCMSHHIRKPSLKSTETPSPLEKSDLRSWFLQARGARALINGSDVRLGVDTPSVEGQLRSVVAKHKEEIALVLRGFGRIRGEIGPIYLARVFDEEGLPLGYSCLTDVKLLFNPDQEAAYARLPEAFRFSEAKRVYGRRDQPTTDFLKKCQGLGLLRKVGRGLYEKPREVE